jgi:hypothetical protein
MKKERKHYTAEDPYLCVLCVAEIRVARVGFMTSRDKTSMGVLSPRCLGGENEAFCVSSGCFHSRFCWGAKDEFLPLR